MIPCTAQVLTRDNADTIAACLDSLREFAQVIVHDGYSTDGTREIALRYPNVTIVDQDRVLLEPSGAISDFGAMRNASLAHAKYPWVLVVDADEEVLPALRDEVRSIALDEQPGVYNVFRRFWIAGERIDHCAGYPTYQIRFFHRDCVNGYRKKVHEKLALRPGLIVQTMRGELKVPMPPLSRLQTKYDRYQRMEVGRLTPMRWGAWFRHIALRNLRSVAGLAARLLWIWLIPRKGKRMPLAYDLDYMRRSLLLIVKTCPFLASRP